MAEENEHAGTQKVEEEPGTEDATNALNRAKADLEVAREMLARREEELAQATDDGAALARRAKESEARMVNAVARYRMAVLRAESTLPEELVGGDSIEAIDQSLAHARNVVAKVRAQAKRDLEREGPPLPADVLANMTAEQKIRYGLLRRG